MKKIKCCGCSACEQICPKKCIKMVEDEEGYLYPEIDKEKCIECGLCKKVCPMLNSEKVKQCNENKFYKFISKNKKIIEQSSSGGAFSEITQAIIENNKDKTYRIYGCVFDENLTAKHIEVDDINDISVFRKSKYLQSNICNIYTKVYQNLKDGLVVIFTGTPCQIAGLKLFLNIKKDVNIENLYTIDIICHGVPSQKVFNEYIKSIEKKHNSKVKKFSFREKNKIGNIIDSLGIKVEFENGTVLNEYSFNNIYMLGFFNGIYYRPCCEQCPFSSIDRCSDITIGDFWGINYIDKKLNAHNGISLCIVNSNNGEKIIKNLSEEMNITQENSDIAIKNNGNLYKPSKFSKYRNDFFKKLKEADNFEKSIKKYVRRKSKLEFIISNNLNEDFKNKIKKIVKKN